jgi:hypothetical protein
VALHKTVRETLVFLTHLDHQQTEEVMIEKLGQQVHPAPGGQGWSRQVLKSCGVMRFRLKLNTPALGRHTYHVCSLFVSPYSSPSACTAAAVHSLLGDRVHFGCDAGG